MTFPTIPTTGNARILSQNQNDTTATRTFPSLSSLTGKASGHLLVAIVVAYERSAAGATFSGWTGGFAEVADVDGGATTMAVGVATKTSTGSETGTFAVTQAATVVGHCTLFVMSIEGWHGTTAPELTALAVGTTAEADPAALTPSWGAEDTLWIAVGGNGETNTGQAWSGMGANTPPTNYGDGNSPGIGTDAVGGIESTVAFRQNNTASENVGIWSTNDLTNARNCALLIAIRPSPSTSATVTPDVVAAVAAVPAPTVSGSALVVAVTVAAVAAVPEPKAVGGLIGPVRWDTTDAQWGSSATQWGGASGDATVTPATVAAVASVPAVTVLVGATPATVAAIAAVPSVTVQAGAGVAPAVVAAVAAVPTVTIVIRNVSDWSEVVTATSIGGGITIEVGPVAALADVPTPNVSGAALVTPTVVAATAAVPSVTVAAGAGISPAVVAAIAAIPAPTVTVGGSVTINATTVAATAAVPAPTVTGAGNVSATTVAAVAAVPAPTVRVSVLITPGVVAAIAAVPAPTVTVGGDASVTPAVVAAVAAVPAPVVATGALIPAATVAAIAAVPPPVVGQSRGLVTTRHRNTPTTTSRSRSTAGVYTRHRQASTVGG